MVVMVMVVVVVVVMVMVVVVVVCVFVEGGRINREEDVISVCVENDGKSFAKRCTPKRYIDAGLSIRVHTNVNTSARWSLFHHVVAITQVHHAVRSSASRHV